MSPVAKPHPDTDAVYGDESMTQDAGETPQLWQGDQA